MYPSIVFETKPSQFHVVRVYLDSLTEHLQTPQTFNALIAQISGRVSHDVVAGGHKALPLGRELSGAWSLSSPLGQESTTPSAGWRFDERIKLATTLESHPLMVIPALGLSRRAVEQAIELVLGRVVKSKTTLYKERTQLDESLDNLFSDDGGTC